MPSSGGSASDAPVNKVVDGKSHYLAYITPDEGQSLKQQGGQEVITDSGIQAYPPLGQPGTSPGTSESGGSRGEPPGGGDPGMTYTAPPQEYQPPEVNIEPKNVEKVHSAAMDFFAENVPEGAPIHHAVDTPSQIIEQTELDIKQGVKPPGEVGGPGPTYEEQQIFADWDTKPVEQKQEIINKALNEFEELPQVDYITNDDKNKVSKIIIDGGLFAFNLLKNNLVGAFTGIAKALLPLSDMSLAAQKKAMTWSINSRLKSIQKKSDFHPGAYGYKIADLNKDLAGVQDGTFTQRDFTAKYGSGDTSNPLDASYIPPTGGERTANEDSGLVNVITPNVTGVSTPINSVAAQWYANLGNGPSNPGAFNLTQQYAAAKAAVSQRLGSPTSIGQLAVNQSPFYNWLKDNSLNKGIL